MRFRITTINCLSVVVFITVFSGLLTKISSQSKVDFEKQRDILNDHINLLSNSLDEATTKRKGHDDQYKLLNSELAKRQELNSLIQSELEQLNEEVDNIESQSDYLDSVISIQKAMIQNTLKTEYYYEFIRPKLRWTLNKNSLHEGLVAWLGLRRTNRAFLSRIRRLTEMWRFLEGHAVRVQSKKQERESVLEIERENLTNINKRRTESAKLLSALEQEESRLRNIYERQIAERQRLNDLISGIISSDNSRSEENSRIRIGQISTQFRNNKNRIPWPVAVGEISNHFGTYPHPEIDGVFIQNLGIDLNCPKNLNVSAVFRGRVIAVEHLPPYDHVVLVSHGEFTSAYYNLTDVVVKKGEDVGIGQLLGQLRGNNDEVSFHFELWEHQRQLDPEHWLSNRF